MVALHKLIIVIFLDFFCRAAARFDISTALCPFAMKGNVKLSMKNGKSFWKCA